MVKMSKKIEYNEYELYFYKKAIVRAVHYIKYSIEPTSALKQAGRDVGIEFGQPMKKFVIWGLAALKGKQN
jgi:hypothetical protein